MQDCEEKNGRALLTADRYPGRGQRLTIEADGSLVVAAV